MLLLPNITTKDEFDPATTIEGEFANRLVYTVANASVAAQFKRPRDPAIASSGDWYPEPGGLLLPPSSNIIDKCTGFRVRSAIVNTPAQVVAQLLEPGDILPGGGTPFTGVLSSSGGFTPPATGGAMQLIQDILLGADTPNIDFIGISNKFIHLKIHAQLRSTAAGSSDPVGLRFQGDGGGNYRQQFLRALGAAVSSAFTNAATSIRVGEIPAAGSAAGVAGTLEIFVPDYTRASFVQQALGHSVGIDATALTGFIDVAGGHRAGAGAIDHITLICAGNFAAGSRATLYGIGS